MFIRQRTPRSTTSLYQGHYVGRQTECPESLGRSILPYKYSGSGIKDNPRFNGASTSSLPVLLKKERTPAVLLIYPIINIFVCAF